MDSYEELRTLEELRESNGNNFRALDYLTGVEYDVVWLFSGVFGLTDDQGYGKFISGKQKRYQLIEKGDKMKDAITPEEQKAAREKERQKSNDRITRQLKMKSSWDDKFKNTIKKQTTKKKSPFTVIEGGKK